MEAARNVWHRFLQFIRGLLPWRLPGDRRPWSRDVAVQELTDYYEFIQRLYLPRDAILYPPAGGWPQITSEACRMGFKLDEYDRNIAGPKHHSDAAVDFMRHVPYLTEEGGNSGGWCGGEWTVFGQSFCFQHNLIFARAAAARSSSEPTPWWTRTWLWRAIESIHWKIQLWKHDRDSWVRVQRAIRREKPERDNPGYTGHYMFTREPLPSHIVLVAIGTRDSDILLFDVNTGDWIFYPNMAGNWYEDEFRYPVGSGFFEEIKDKFRNLEWLPDEHVHGRLQEVHSEWPDDRQDQIIAAMKEAGWPGDGEARNWDRKFVHRTLVELYDEDDPGSYCNDCV